MVLSIIFLVFFAIISALLVFLVLVQDESGDGLGSMFGGDTQSRNIGRRSGNILTRITTILGAIFMLSAFGLAWLNRTPGSDSIEGSLRESLRDDQVEWWITDEEPPEEEGE